MTAAGTYKTASSRSESRPLLWALLISLAVHVLAVWTLVVVGAAMLVFSSVRREVLAEMQRTQQARAAAQKQPEPVMMFVDVDPNHADQGKRPKTPSIILPTAPRPQILTPKPTPIPQKSTAPRSTSSRPRIPPAPNSFRCSTRPRPRRSPSPTNQPPKDNPKAGFNPHPKFPPAIWP